MKLFDMAHVLRSKNSGPFAVTLDILFDDREKYERVKKSGKITPASIARRFKADAALDVPQAISWADEERDVSAWLGNELQQDAYNKLYGLYEKLAILNQPSMWNDFGHLQESDHFYYMSTKFFSDGAVHKYFNPYDTPYEAFINYMNVLSDFTIRVDDALATK